MTPRPPGDVVVEVTAASAGAVVVVGTGQAGFQLAQSLREAGHTGPLTLVGDEPGLPYQRPPLSKDFLLDGVEPDSTLLRGDSFYADRDITVLAGQRVTAIDRTSARVVLRCGDRLRYDHLVLATGTRARTLTVPGSDLDGVLTLRTLADAVSLRRQLARPRAIVIVGAGFVGLEVAAAASRAGHRVTVVEGLDRVLSRVAAPEVSAHVQSVHEAHGCRILLGSGVVAIHPAEHRQGAVGAVELASGETLTADLVLVGVGAEPNSELAAAAGLDVCAATRGVLVDDRLLSSDPRISAIGDCATYPSAHAGGQVRLESVQNAVDHARHVAGRIATGSTGSYAKVPWFWTTQYDMKIQIAGVGGPGDDCLTAGDPASGRFSVLRFNGDGLVAVESVNRAADHMAARRLLDGAGGRPSLREAASPDFELKAYLTASNRSLTPAMSVGAP